MATVNTMVIAVSPVTGVITVTPTLPGGAAAVAFMQFLFRPYGSQGKYQSSYMTLTANVPQTRQPLPYTDTEFIIRVVDINGAVYDSPAQRMNYAQSTNAVNWTEVHVPEHSIIGEQSRAHAFQFQLKAGSMVSGSIVDPTLRPVLVPEGSGVGPYVQSGKFFASTTSFLAVDEGYRLHSFALGA